RRSHGFLAGLALLIPAFLIPASATAQTPLQLSCNQTPLPATFNLTVNIAVAMNCSGLGGTQPYTFAISSGALPPGLMNLTAGTQFLINGTPTVAEIYPYTIRISDQAGASTSLAFVANVVPGAATPITLNTITPNAFSAGTAVGLTLLGSGFTAND